MKIEKRIEKFGNKKVRVYHDNFEYYQPNRHICGDCAVRAITKVLPMTWKDAYLDACKETADEMYTFNETKGMTIYLEKRGFKWVPIRPEGSKRPIVHEFAEEHDDGKRYILNVSNHFVACHDGKYYDIWDCGEKSLYGYWVKE